MRASITRANQINQIDQIMYEIVWHAQKQITHTLTQPQIDLTLPQLMTLFAVRHAGSCRMSELAEQTRQSAGTLTGIVDRLIADGLLDRARNVSDRRVIEVALTPEGERRLTEAVAAHRGEMQYSLEQFSDNELDQFWGLLDRFRTGLHHDMVQIE